MSNAVPAGSIRVPPAVNEPVLGYLPGSAERLELERRWRSMASERVDIPLVIGGRDVRTGQLGTSVMPHNHAHVLADWHKGGRADVEAAITAALAAGRDWSRWSLEDRSAIFLRAAELLATTWRSTLNAATMLGQSKTIFQAEIDAACELVDFWRYNAQFAQQIQDDQPRSSPGTWNRLDYRPLEGFVLAVTPFNFTSIAGNLPTAPALMGNTVVWKPAASAMLSAHYVMRLLEAAGLPPGVINLVAGDPAEVSSVALESTDLAGIHFTGSTEVFQGMWRAVGEHIARYRSFPRLVGETGGKDFIVAHPSADSQELAVAIVRGGFEYQGQKCSAASRIYVPSSRWPDVRDRVIAMMDDIHVGDVTDAETFMGAVIDRKAFDRICGYLDDARRTARVVHGAGARGDHGHFIDPTLILTDDPAHRLLREEVFGPVVTVYVYPEGSWRDTLSLVDRTSPYGLTGAVFARDRAAVADALDVLRNAAGNVYVNDKPTGAVVGQQPFGGARASGTNDKAGSKLNLLRWVSPRTVKETFTPSRDYRYPHMRHS